MLRIFLIFICLLTASFQLQAGSWGKTEKTTEFAGDIWTEVYINLDNLKLKALIPNYSHACFYDGFVHLIGQKGSRIGYIIQTSYDPTFIIIGDSQQELVAAIQKGNPQFCVVPVGVEIPGVDFAVDLIPREKNVTAHWRFLWTSNRIIQVGTDDADAQCRLYFFESVQLE